MHAFFCANSTLTRCDTPNLRGNYHELAYQFGFEVSPEDTRHTRTGVFAVCRPICGQEVYLTIHGQERTIYALVVWEQSASLTLFFTATPFDLVTAVEAVARYEKALFDIQHFARQDTDIQPVECAVDALP